jgi:hypothetical protein
VERILVFTLTIRLLERRWRKKLHGRRVWYLFAIARDEVWRAGEARDLRTMLIGSFRIKANWLIDRRHEESERRRVLVLVLAQLDGIVSFTSQYPIPTVFWLDPGNRHVEGKMDYWRILFHAVCNSWVFLWKWSDRTETVSSWSELNWPCRWWRRKLYKILFVMGCVSRGVCSWKWSHSHASSLSSLRIAFTEWVFGCLGESKLRRKVSQKDGSRDQSSSFTLEARLCSAFACLLEVEVVKKKRWHALSSELTLQYVL